jgi:hypothetical protein
LIAICDESVSAECFAKDFFVIAPAPKTLADDLIDQVKALFEVGRIGSAGSWQIASLNRDIDKLAKTNVLIADCLRISLATLQGDDAAVTERMRNLELNGHASEAFAEQMRFAGNRLRASEFFALANKAIENPPSRPLHEILPSLVTTGAFRPASTILEKATKDGRVTQATADIQLVRDGARVLDALGIPDDVVAATVDEVGKLLWERKLLWLDSKANVWTSPAEASEQAVLMQYRVSISPVEAADLSWTLSERLAEKDLLRTGFAVAFLGSGEPHVAAA